MSLVEALAQQFIAAGGRFECEMLQTGHASLTLHEVDGEDRDIAIEVCWNGPEVPERVDALVRRSVAWRSGGEQHARAERDRLP